MKYRNQAYLTIRKQTMEFLFPMVFAWAMAGAVFSQTWTNLSPPTGDTYAVVCSADGSTIITTPGVCISTNAGASWTNTEVYGDGSSVACSYPCS